MLLLCNVSSGADITFDEARETKKSVLLQKLEQNMQSWYLAGRRQVG